MQNSDTCAGRSRARQIIRETYSRRKHDGHVSGYWRASQDVVSAAHGLSKTAERHTRRVMHAEQTRVIKRLAEVSRMLDTATDEIARLDEQAVVAKQAFEVKYAEAFIKAEGSMEMRKHKATLMSASERLEYELAYAKHRACKERMNTLRNQISTGQTVSAALRHQFAAEGVGQYT